MIVNRFVQRWVCRYIGHSWKQEILPAGVWPSWKTCRWCKQEIDKGQMFPMGRKHHAFKDAPKPPKETSA